MQGTKAWNFCNIRKYWFSRQHVDEGNEGRLFSGNRKDTRAFPAGKTIRVYEIYIVFGNTIMMDNPGIIWRAKARYF